MNKYIQQQADNYAAAHNAEVDARRTAYIAGSMRAQSDIKAELVSLRDNYMRQLEVPGRSDTGFAFIAGKVEAIHAVLEILKRYE